MKYFKKALVESGTLWLSILDTTLSMIYIVINTLILAWLSEVFISTEGPIIPIIKVISGCCVNTVLHVATTYMKYRENHCMYRSLLFIFIDKVIDADYDMFTKYSTGDLLSVITGTLGKINMLPRTILSIISKAIMFIITAAAMIIIDKKSSIPIFIIYGVAGFTLYRATKRWSKLDAEVDNLRRAKVKLIDEVVLGFAEIRSFDGVAKRQYNELRENDNVTMEKLRDRSIVDGKITFNCLLADTIMMVFVIFISLWNITNGTMLAPTAIIMVTYAWRLIDPLAGIIDMAGMVSEGIAAMPKFTEIMEYDNIVEKGYLDLAEFNSEIILNDVGFSYSTSEDVLDKVSLTIKKGEHIGICGPSGGGKSTLVKLIPRFYDVTSGSITIDGVDIRKYTRESIIRHMGIVHQDPCIFDMTIADNLRYARKDRNVTIAEMKCACKKACIYDFIMSLPDRFDTHVGPRGLKLSGGQQQRLALARLFISDPEIIILDEATSALDNETEKAIQRAIDELHDKTIIVIAHRLSTIKKSDKIVVIDNHRVAEEGTHDELIKQSGLYANMIKIAEEKDI